MLIRPFLLKYLEELEKEVCVCRTNLYSDKHTMHPIDMEKVTLFVTPQEWRGELLGVFFYPVLKDAGDGAFMKAMDVQVDGPAYRADLRNKDRIIEFGTINASTYVTIDDSIIPLIYRQGLGVPIPILVQREVLGNIEYVPLTLTPSLWNGPGTIGYDTNQHILLNGTPV